MPDQDPPESSPTIVPSIFWTEVSGVSEKPGRSGKTKESIGERLSRLRRERGITQMELAEQLGVAQPVVSDYERGELRLHGQTIVELTRILRVSADEILGLEKLKGNGTIKDRRLLRRLQGLERLPKRDQLALLRTIDAFLAKAS